MANRIITLSCVLALAAAVVQSDLEVQAALRQDESCGEASDCQGSIQLRQLRIQQHSRAIAKSNVEADASETEIVAVDSNTSAGSRQGAQGPSGMEPYNMWDDQCLDCKDSHNCACNNNPPGHTKLGTIGLQECVRRCENSFNCVVVYCDNGKAWHSNGPLTRSSCLCHHYTTCESTRVPQNRGISYKKLGFRNTCGDTTIVHHHHAAARPQPTVPAIVNPSQQTQIPLGTTNCYCTHPFGIPCNKGCHHIPSPGACGSTYGCKWR